jgi:hypothetical protein
MYYVFDMFYIQWRRLAKRIYGINKYMNMNTGYNFFMKLIAVIFQENYYS